MTGGEAPPSTGESVADGGTKVYLALVHHEIGTGGPMIVGVSTRYEVAQAYIGAEWLRLTADGDPTERRPQIITLELDDPDAMVIL